MTAYDLLVEIVAVKGNCPVYKSGDNFIISQGYVLQTGTIEKVCLHSLAPLLPYYVPLSRGVEPGELGLGEKTAYLQCPDPCQYTGGGTVIFAIQIAGKEDIDGL